MTVIKNGKGQEKGANLVCATRNEREKMRGEKRRGKNMKTKRSGKIGK